MQYSLNKFRSLRFVGTMGHVSAATVTNLHMLDFLDTVVLGDEGGVWYDHVQSEPFRSTITLRKLNKVV